MKLSERVSGINILQTRLKTLKLTWNSLTFLLWTDFCTDVSWSSSHSMYKGQLASVASVTIAVTLVGVTGVCVGCDGATATGGVAFEESVETTVARRLDRRADIVSQVTREKSKNERRQ
jgi:hypothetical protein